MSNKSLADIVNEASVEAIEAETKANLKIRAKAVELAKVYLDWKQDRDDAEYEMQKIRAELIKIGDWETDEYKAKVSYGSDIAKVKPLKDFIAAGFSEKYLGQKDLLTYYYSGDRLTITERKKKKKGSK